MTEHLPTTHESAVHGHPTSAETLFTSEELQAFRKEDIMAGAVIICLMTAIFTIGLVLYIGVTLSVLER